MPRDAAIIRTAETARRAGIARTVETARTAETASSISAGIIRAADRDREDPVREHLSEEHWNPNKNTDT